MGYSTYSAQNPFGFSVTPWVKRLLLANVVMFLITLAFSGLKPFLGLIPERLLLQPWSPITYMFVHDGFLHLLFNMLGLFFFGPPLEERWGSRGFLKFYLIAGLGGALLSLFFPNSLVIGASGAVYGIMVAFAMFWPDNPIYIYGIFPIKAKWLVAGLVGLSAFFALTGGQTGTAHLAHFGGAAAAFLYLKSPFAPPEWGEVPTHRPRRRSPWKALTAATRKKDPTPDPIPTTRARDERRDLDDVDRILDKISQSGLGSLTPEERTLLDEASRRFRSN